MVTLNAVFTRNAISRSPLRIGGIFTMVFSVAMGLLILFVIPGACTFVGSIQLLILGFLFVAGGIALLLGSTLLRNKRL